MATATLLNPASESAEDRKSEAQKHWKAILQSSPLLSTNSLRIGFHAAALQRENLWGVIGYTDKTEAQKHSGIKESTWHNVIRIAEAYPGVDEKLFVAMKLTNAQTMMDLPESKRLTEYWLRMAATDAMEVFKEKIDQEMEDKARPSDGRERSVEFRAKMPKSRKKFVDDGILQFAESVGYKGDISKGLELLVAEHREGVSLIESIRKAIDHISNIKKLKDSGLSADEVLEKADAELNEMLTVFTEALQGVQNLESAE